GMDVSPDFIRVASQKNPCGNVYFELTTGSEIAPELPKMWDIVFSYEVFHYLDQATFARYCHDAFGLLKPGGDFLFRYNTTPMRLRSRIAGLVRAMLHECGIKLWRGLPTA